MSYRRPPTGQGGVYLDIEDDLVEANERLKALGVNMKRVMRYMFTGIGREGAKKVKKAYSATGLRKQTGKLYKSISYWTNKGQIKWMYIGLKRKSRSKEDDISYGYMLAHGYKVDTKHKNATGFVFMPMQFKTSNGKWVTKMSYRVSSHDFVVGPVQRWMYSPEYNAKVDQLIDKQVQNIMNKKKVESSV